MGQALGTGTLDDKYFLQKVKLGEGSFGVVWRAHERESNAIVAIKQIDKKRMITRGATKEDITREISMMKECKHVNITELYDTFEDETQISLALEYCDGGDFGDKVKSYERSDNLQEPLAADWTRQICAAITCLHSKEICHRDIKPDNFMVSGEQLKLSDFGLAIQAPKGERLKVRCGTPAFMAPEALRLPDSPGYSYEVDVWAAGVILYMLMCAGKHPFITSDNRFDEKMCHAGCLDFSAHEPRGVKYLMKKPSRFSEAARMLSRKMVEPDPTKRISARAALEEPWLVSTWQANNAGRGGLLAPAATGSLVDAVRPDTAAGVPHDASGPPGAVGTLVGLALFAPVAMAALAAQSDSGRRAADSSEITSRGGCADSPAPKRRSGAPIGLQAGLAAVAVSASIPPNAPAGKAADTVSPAAPDSCADSQSCAPPTADWRQRKFDEPASKARRDMSRPEANAITIVMVGPTGQGKSTLGNMLAGGGNGYMPFKTSDDFDSETLDCAHADFSVKQQSHRAIDTIGFLDTRMDAAENMDKFSCFADRAPGGIDVFFFVLKKGRFTEQSMGQLQAFRSVAGESALKHTILVFTHCGEETSEALRLRCESSTNQHLKDAVTSCVRVLGVDSLSEMRSADDRTDLLGTVADVVQANNGLKYDNATLTEARHRRWALTERIQLLSRERRDAMLDKMHALLNGRLTSDQVEKALDEAIENEEREKRAAAEGASLQALLAAAKSEASAWKEVAKNALRGSSDGAGNALGLAGCCNPVPGNQLGVAGVF